MVWWDTAVAEVDRDIAELTEHFKNIIPAHPAPKILALRILLAQERNRLCSSKKTE